jgi:hypothetical protein
VTHYLRVKWGECADNKLLSWSGIDCPVCKLIFRCRIELLENNTPLHVSTQRRPCKLQKRADVLQIAHGVVSKPKHVAPNGGMIHGRWMWRYLEDVIDILSVHVLWVNEENTEISVKLANHTLRLELAYLQNKKKQTFAGAPRVGHSYSCISLTLKLIFVYFFDLEIYVQKKRKNVRNIEAPFPLLSLTRNKHYMFWICVCSLSYPI